jgi:glycosyltransferase involved in cell wall biosynthesis
MKVIITIPSYNEENDIEKVIKGIRKVMSSSKYNFKILVLDDGSSDNTAKIARKNGAIVISHKRNMGLAETFKDEMKECLRLKADIIVHTDADGQYPNEAIPQLIRKIEEGYDLVLGSRFEKGKYSGSLFKKIGNIAFAKVFSGLLRTKITDTTTGFRAFKKDVAELPLINKFTYTQEQLIRAGRANMKITEIPINAKKTRESRLFRNPLEYAFKSWINILRVYRDFAPLKFFGLIGLLFIFLGGVIGVWIVYNVITTGAAGGIPRVILSALLIMTGVQIALFGFLADMQRR